MWSMILLMFLRLGALAVFSASDNYVTLHLAIINVSFLADRTNGRAIATLLRLSSSVCDVMYCG